MLSYNETSYSKVYQTYINLTPSAMQTSYSIFYCFAALEAFSSTITFHPVMQHRLKDVSGNLNINRISFNDKITKYVTVNHMITKN